MSDKNYKATVELNGLTLTNANPVSSGAAVHNQNGKRIKVEVLGSWYKHIPTSYRNWMDEMRYATEVLYGCIIWLIGLNECF